MKKYNVAVVGVGAVGEEILRVLSQRNFPINELRVFARSSRAIKVDDKTYSVKAISHKSFDGIDIALFAGTEGEKGASLTYASSAVKSGAVVIDNGADYRMNPDVPLVVPEVNAADINPVRDWFFSGSSKISNGVKKHKGIIANPNCSTIQMAVALWPIYKLSRIKRIIVCSYQAASGAGRAAVKELYSQTKEIIDGRKELMPKALPAQIAFNVFPQIGAFGEYGYTSEEWKMVKETHKIFHDERLKISSTCVRVPVHTGHSEAIYIETQRTLSIEKVRNVLNKAQGIKYIDSPAQGLYPLAINAHGKDDVFVGRLRKDPNVNNALWLWVVSDNLRKGASLNAVQIAECVISS